MQNLSYFPLCLLILFELCACQPAGQSSIETMKAYTNEGNINVVVEIPAGTNHKVEYDKASKKFDVDLLDGQPRVIDFLPYPGNYGFIPGTFMDPARGGDGDALDILVIGESQATGTVLEAKPIGALLLKDNGELDTKIIAVPANAEEQIMAVNSFLDFMLEYDAARQIIENWFLNYKGFGEMEFIGWQDEAFAMEEINKWKN